MGQSNLCLEIQEIIIKKIIYVERKIRYNKSQIDRYKLELRQKKTPKLNKEEAKVIKEQIEYTEYLVDVYQQVHKLFKSIGDALAFIYIDKWDIKPIAFKDTPGFILGKKGSRLERKIFRTILNTGEIAILNDITNSLRYGDITLVSSLGFKLIEVKSSKNNTSRNRRQALNLEKISNYFMTDKVLDLYKNGEEMFRESLLSQEADRRIELNNIIQTARIDGYGWSQIETGLFYVAAYQLDSNILNEIKNRCSSDVHIWYINEFSFNSTGYYPFTLSIKNSEAILDFYNRNLHLLVFIDYTTLYNKFSSKDLTITSLDDSNWLFHISSASPSSDDRFLRISNHFFYRVPLEFLSLDWFIDEIVYKFNNLETMISNHLDVL
jgi:hypothetical protein